MDRPITAPENRPGIVDVACDFGKSLVQGAVITPVWNGLGQLISAGHLPQISITNSDNAKSSSTDAWAQKIGCAVGMAADFFLLSKTKVAAFGETAAAETAGTLSLAQKSLLSAGESAKVGALYGAIFVPSAPGDNIVTGRVKNAFTNGITFGALAGMTAGVSSLPVFGKIMPGTVANTIKDIGISGAVGFPAGAIGAEADSLLNHGKVADWSSIKDQAVDYGVIGFALAGMTHGLNALTPARISTEPQMPQVFDNSGIRAVGPEVQFTSRPAHIQSEQSGLTGEQVAKNATPSRVNTGFGDAAVVSRTVRDTFAGKLTHTMLADQTTIEHHALDDITITTKPDGTIIRESNDGVLTEYPDGRQLNVHSYGTESRSIDGTWTATENRWAQVWKNWWETDDYNQKFAALSSLDEIPKGRNLVANLVANGLSDSDGLLNEVAMQGIKTIPHPRDQFEQWSTAWTNLPEHSDYLIGMIPELRDGAQRAVLEGRAEGGIARLIALMTDFNERAGDPAAEETAMNDYITGVQRLPKESRKAIWDQLGMSLKNGQVAYQNNSLQALAEHISKAITTADANGQSASLAFGEFHNQMRPYLNPLDSIQESQVSRSDMRVKSVNDTERKFQEFKGIMEAPQSEPTMQAQMQAVDRAQRLAEEFLMQNHEIELGKRIIEWGESQPDESIAAFIKWKFSPAKRSVQLTNDFIAHAKRDGLSTYQFTRALQDPFALSKRADEFHITSEQIMATKQNVVQLMDIANLNRAPNGDLTRAGDSFRMSALQSMAQSADPFLIVQGPHPTCALTQLEFSTYMKHPDEATRLINEVMRTGKFVTQDGTEIVIKPGSLKPEDGSLEPNKRMYEQSPSYRSYASQIFQMTAANIYWQRQTFAPDGSMVPKGSLHYEINSSAAKGPQDVLVDYSQKPPKVVSKGPQIVILGDQLREIGEQIGGKLTEPTVIETLPHDKVALKEFLLKLRYPEDFPLIVTADGHAMQDAKLSRVPLMNHAISIVAPWQLGDHIFIRNTWDPGDTVHEHMNESRFRQIAGYGN